MMIGDVEYLPSEVTVDFFDIGQPMTIVITPNNSGVTHTLRYQIGSRASGVIAERTAETTVVWETPLELCGYLPDTTIGYGYLTCETYYGDTPVGTSQTIVSYHVPPTVALTLHEGWATIVPDNKGTMFRNIDALVQGYSMGRIVFDTTKITMENAYGATISSLSAGYNGTEADEDFRTEVLYSDSVEFVCTVTDSRGRTLTQTITAAVHPYAKPTVSEVQIYRCDSDGNPDEGGMAVYLSAKYTVSALGGKNDYVAHARYRSAGGAYGASEVLPYSGSGVVLWDGELSPQKTYEVCLQCMDHTTSTGVVTVIIPTDEAFFHGRSGGKGAAFGKYAEADNLLDVEWDLKTGGDLTVGGGITIGGKALWDYLMPVGYIYTSADPTSPAELFGGQWEQLKDVFLLAAGDTYAADSEGGAATVTLTEDQMPEHIHAIHSRTIYNNDGSSNGLCILLYGNETTHAGMYPAGGSQPHENMPPYVAKYMWQRVA